MNLTRVIKKLSEWVAFALLTVAVFWLIFAD
jgi:hypothetical protein